MTNPEYFQGVHVIAVRNFVKSKCPTIDLRISKCDACQCIQLTEECNQSFSAEVTWAFG